MTAGLIRFEQFEVNLRSGELCKGRERIRLPEQSFQILAMLLEYPGEVVLRREIRKKLWPNDTVVEFENSINAAVKRLRVALGDSADQPRYIETLARRGYRWMVPVEYGEAPQASGAPEGARIGCHVVRDGSGIGADFRGATFRGAVRHGAEYGHRPRCLHGVVHCLRSTVPA